VGRWKTYIDDTYSDMKISKLVFVFLLMIISIMSVFAQTSTNTFWPGFKVKSQFQVEEEFHYYAGPQAAMLNYEHTDLQYKYLANSYFDVFGSYRLIFKESANTWQNYNMFVPGFDLKLPTQSWGTLNLRTKVEITPANQHGNIPATYMQAEWLKYNTPWKFTKYEINPFVGDEPFFNAADRYDFVRNRVTVGMDFKITPSIRGTLMYWYQTDKNIKSQTWTGSDYIVAQLKFLF